MPNEALWSQAVGVEYSAAEDRKLLSTVWPTAGVLTGLSVTPGVGRTVTVSAGRAVIPDGNGGAYLAYLTGTVADVTVSANVTANNRTDGVYLTVDDPGTGDSVVTVVAGDSPAPTDPYVKLATVVVPPSATTITAGNINTSVRTTAGDPKYLQRTDIQYGPIASLPATLPVGAVYLGYV